MKVTMNQTSMAVIPNFQGLQVEEGAQLPESWNLTKTIQILEGKKKAFGIPRKNYLKTNDITISGIRKSTVPGHESQDVIALSKECKAAKLIGEFPTVMVKSPKKLAQAVIRIIETFNTKYCERCFTGFIISKITKHI